MSAFSADWLALRECADARARDASLAASLLASRPSGKTLRVVDLGSGIGANLRYMAPRLGHDQHWLLIDYDSALLDHAPVEMQAWADTHGYGVTRVRDGLRFDARDFSAELHWRRLDLATQLDELTLNRVDLVTASALLDLVSRDWIDELARRCWANRCAVLFALTYDGHVLWRPTLAADQDIEALLNRHQGRDKGFGPAAGPAASGYAHQYLEALGFDVQQGRSDWRLIAADAKLQEELARGWAQAALEMDPARRSAIAAWLDVRLGHIQRQDSELTVGHIDLFALPPSV
jgi:SAM-dependent methyltransferase